ncbi:thioredoxin-like protein [Cladochytrium replicatum]|nr:thioredoxin-like protein [Cladochytrium replicatum]
MERIRTMKENAHGTYRRIDLEKELMQITTNTKLCVVHFFHKEFRRCQIMDSHLEKLARKHFKTRFMKIDVEDAPFLVDKLKVKVLPTVICFVDSVSVDRIIGFDELGGTDSFSTANLEKRLLKAKVILLSDYEDDDC